MYKSMMLEFPVEEYRARVDKLIAGMQKHGMDAILLSSKENTRYFSGLQSIVWDSKIAVPGLLIVTANGDMTIVSSTSNQPTVTVTSCIEPEKLLAYSRTNEPGYPDTFPKAIAYALEKFNVKSGRIGMEIGHGFRVAMSHADQNALMALIPDATIVDAAEMLWEIRRVKSPLEIEAIRKVCQINVAAYKKGFESIVCGKTTEEEVYRIMAAESYLQGAENMLPLGIRCGYERYPQGNCPPSKRVIGQKEGEMMLIDGGPCYMGYYSDIIRQAVTGKPSARQQEIYDVAVAGNELGLSVIKAGVRACDVCKTVDDFFDAQGFGHLNRCRGWMGHGLGLDVHEMPTLSMDCKTVLEPGMVMALEPELFDRELGVFGIEQNFVVTETGCELLTPAPTGLICLEM